MKEILELCGMFAIVFAVSVAASYVFVTFKLKRAVPKPLENGVLQIRSGTAMHRSRFARETADGWVIHAPLNRDAYVPIRPGEKLAILMPTEHGLRHFETVVTHRDIRTHELTVKPPTRMTVVERRQSERVDKFLNPNASIEGRAATLVDLSSGGVRLVTGDPLKKGERAAIDLPETGRVFGWVLDSAPSTPGYVLRLRFEEPVQIKA